MWNCWFIAVMVEQYKVRAGSVSQWLEKCPVREGNWPLFFIPSSLFCRVLNFIWEKLEANSLLFLTLFFLVWNKSFAELPSAFCLCIQVPFMLFSFKYQMKIRLQLEMSFFFFFFSHVHNYCPVRERSCICVKINFLNFFKLSSLAAITALHNEPFIFWYPEGGSSINIFNCPFCVSQRWDSQYEKCPECLIILNSFSHINFYSTIPDGTLPFPRCTHISIYVANVWITIQGFQGWALGPIIWCQ